MPRYLVPIANRAFEFKKPLLLREIEMLQGASLPDWEGARAEARDRLARSARRARPSVRSTGRAGAMDGTARAAAP